MHHTFLWLFSYILRSYILLWLWLYFTFRLVIVVISTLQVQIFGRPFVKRFIICYRTVLSVCLDVTLAYYGQMVGWIKMKLDVEIGLGPCDIVLDGDPAPPPQKGGTAPSIFGPFMWWPNVWMERDATWYGRRPRPRPRCLRWGTRSPP